MQVEFRTRVLERCYTEHRAAVQRWGEQVARSYVKAVNALKAAESPTDLVALPQFRYHRLKADRAEQHTMTLAYRARLVFTVHDEEPGTLVRIEEVDPKHYE